MCNRLTVYIKKDNYVMIHIAGVVGLGKGVGKYITLGLTSPAYITAMQHFAYNEIYYFMQDSQSS